MTERPSQEARYQAERDNKGLFVPGNQIRKGTTNEAAKRFADTKKGFLALVSEEQRAELWASLFHLATNCEVKDVQLKALIYSLDRVYGKPKEYVELEHSGDSGAAINFNLSPTEQSVISQIFQKVGSAQQPNVIGERNEGKPLIIDQPREAVEGETRG